MDTIYSENPMDRGLYNQLMGLDEKTFEEGISQMLKYYDKLLKEVDGVKYLPKGTILYHGSLDYPFYAESNITKDITYMGLDMDISIWYVYELIMKQQFGLKSFERYGFLYVFKLIEDLPVTHIIDKLYLNPKEVNKCKETSSTCLHPQVSYRGHSFNHVVGSKLHSELTLVYDSYKDYLEIIRVYIIDGLSLHENHGDMDYNVRSSILQEYTEGTEYESSISSEKYSELFLGETFYCDHNCGFSGTYEDVLEHEKTCLGKASKKKKKKKSKRKKSKRKKNKSKRK